VSFKDTSGQTCLITLSWDMCFWEGTGGPDKSGSGSYVSVRGSRQIRKWNLSLMSTPLFVMS
jgi:hypothetical protein